MNFKDLIPILISFVALSLSVVSLYFSNFYKKTSLICALASWNRPSHEDNKVSQSCEFTLSNTGNQELLVREIFIDYTGEKEISLLPVIESHNVPTVIKPGTISIVKFNVPSLFLETLAKHNIMMLVDFHVYTPSVELLHASKAITPAIGDVEPSDSDWEPFRLEKVKV